MVLNCSDKTFKAMILRDYIRNNYDKLDPLELMILSNRVSKLSIEGLIEDEKKVHEELENYKKEVESRKRYQKRKKFWEKKFKKTKN